MITFIEHPIFTHRITNLLTDDQHRDFQKALAADPEAGDVIPGLGGLRKIRMALPGRGKRGGARVLYLLFVRADLIYFVYVFTKGEFEDLPPDKKRAMKKWVERIKAEYRR